MLPVIGALSLAIREFIFLVSYITNNSFPKPLSKEDEKKYLQLMEKGDEYARRKLIEHNLRLVAHIIKKFDCKEENEDLISIGTIGLIKAINTFNQGKGTRLATYAARCIENEILMHLRSTKKNKTEVSLQEPIGIDKEGNEITLLDILGSDSDVVLETVEFKIAQKKLYEIIKTLKAREQQVLKMRFGLPTGERKTQKEIAKKLGISRSYVSRIEKKVIRKLSKEFEAEECPKCGI
ncbi:RNA polymerase sporulation sigma factor SigK [Candidatus Contubernalis alkaliaceticus]|uniref:RNA polymerase sporulation sigma factor SigK n=1 Tax=Candidatus Contubernalis alkaliaceticus TaxID=338645 RepID=UPI001F4BFEB8|nr:RNA polymerase sporulation sigma factor SigK [Candidatus Contubernalis alkalaceticus]UNC92578.1 RNA polymerase sporulation sigma factor SigK [Candidatus Contubernalis alkalaceticus]